MTTGTKITVGIIGFSGFMVMAFALLGSDASFLIRLITFFNGLVAVLSAGLIYDKSR